MTTPMPASPFLSASDGLHPLSSVAVTLGADPTALESVTAEIPELARQVQSALPCANPARDGECEPSVMLAFMPGDPADVTSTSPEAMSAGTDCINEIFTFARGLMRDYQPDFQALLNEIAPFPMEYLPDYRLGDDDQPLFLQGAVA